MMLTFIIIGAWIVGATLSYALMQHVNRVSGWVGDRTVDLIVSLILGPAAPLFAFGYWLGYKIIGP